MVTLGPIVGDNKSANGCLSHTIHSQLSSWSAGITFRREHSIVGVHMFSHTATFLFEETKVESKRRHYCYGTFSLLSGSLIIVEFRILASWVTSKDSEG